MEPSTNPLAPPELGPKVSHCDFCYGAVGEGHLTYLIADGRCLCIECLEKWGEEQWEKGLQVNQTIGLVARGYYAPGGRSDPGVNPALGGRT